MPEVPTCRTNCPSWQLGGCFSFLGRWWLRNPRGHRKGEWTPMHNPEGDAAFVTRRDQSLAGVFLCSASWTCSWILGQGASVLPIVRFVRSKRLHAILRACEMFLLCGTSTTSDQMHGRGNEDSSIIPCSETRASVRFHGACGRAPGGGRPATLGCGLASTLHCCACLAPTVLNSLTVASIYVFESVQCNMLQGIGTRNLYAVCTLEWLVLYLYVPCKVLKSNNFIALADLAPEKTRETDSSRLPSQRLRGGWHRWWAFL